MSASNRYDHPNFIVRREAHKESSAGATASLRWHAFQKSRLKAVHFAPIVAGTNVGAAVAVNQVSGTTTTALGTATIGTNGVGTTVSLSVGAANSPAGITLAALDEVRLTNSTDATFTYGAVIEYEVLPDSVMT